VRPFVCAESASRAGFALVALARDYFSRFPDGRFGLELTGITGHPPAPRGPGLP
jgi:hypothetical protein